MFTRILGVLFFSVVGLTAVPAQATSIGPYTYTVDGQLSIVGNDVCGGPCIETVHFDFRFQWVDTGSIVFQINIIPGFTEITASGPMGETGWRTVEGLFYSPYYFPMGNSSGEIDLDMPDNTFTVTPWIGPTFYASELYSCFTQVCVTDFVGSSQNPDGSGVPPFYGIFLGGTVQSTAQRIDAVPEALWQWKQRGRALA